VKKPLIIMKSGGWLLCFEQPDKDPEFFTNFQKNKSKRNCRQR
jgi:hypothetical protein